MTFRRRLSHLLVALVAALAVAPAAHAATASPTGVIVAMDLTEGRAYVGPVAQFSQVYSDPGGLKAQINWGDDTPPEPGAVMPVAGGQGEFKVSGIHAYAEAGTAPVSVRLTTTEGALVAQASATRSIADAPLTAVPLDLNWNAGVAYPGAAAHFTDANRLSINPAEFTATVDWGDGSAPVPGHVEYLTGGPFKVFAGEHIWTTPGTKTVTTKVTAKHGSTVVITSTFRVAGQLAANFDYSPAPPCANQVIEFNGRTSVSGLRITNYHWEVSHNDAYGTTQRFDGVYPLAEFTFHYTSQEQDLNTGQVKRYSIAPATVTLTITDEAGHTATTTKTVTFADDGFRPTPAQPHPDCDALRRAKLLKGIGITRFDHVWKFRAPCANIADCSLFVRITDLKGKLLASAAQFVRAGTVAQVPTQTTSYGRRYRRCWVRYVVRLTSADGSVVRRYGRWRICR